MTAVVCVQIQRHFSVSSDSSCGPFSPLTISAGSSLLENQGSVGFELCPEC